MKSQKGFALLEGLLIILITAGVGFGGYKVWQSRHDQNTKASNPSKTIKSSALGPGTATLSETQDWKIFSDNGRGFSYSVKLPLNWDVRTITSDSGEGSANGISIVDSSDKSAGFIFSGVLDPQFYQDQLKSDDLSYAWNLFKTQGLKSVVEANRQTTIKSLAANKYIKDKTVGPLEKIAISEGEAWGYPVNAAYGTGFKNDLVSGSVVEKPSTVIFISNGKIVMQGVISTDDATQTKIVQTLKFW